MRFIYLVAFLGVMLGGLFWPTLSQA
ncbi:MAG: hypothetical protein JWP57_2917, partial [Spirosoma sp.]|nr:hypothetical protein [Spirosoma sp.]